MQKNKNKRIRNIPVINLSKIRLFFIVLVSICTLLFLLSGCSDAGTKIKQVQEVFLQEPPSIDEMVICKNVDDNFAPVEPEDIFPAGTNSIYLSVKFNNLTEKDSLKVIWTYKDVQKQLSIQEFSPPEKSSGFHSFNIKISGSFPSGTYTAEIFLNDQTISKLEFIIE